MGGVGHLSHCQLSARTWIHRKLGGILLEFNYFQPLVHFISNKTPGKLLAAPILGIFKAIFNMKISYFHLSSYAYVRLITTCLAQPMFVSFVLMSTFTFIPFYYFNWKRSRIRTEH